MGRSGLKSGLLLSTSVITAALAYSRRAYANCTAVSGPSSAYTCTGAPGGPTTYSFNGSDISVLAEATTVFFNDADFPASNQISISGDGDLTFGSAGSVYLFSRFQFGLRIEHTLGSLTDQGDIRITTANEPPDAIREWGLAGYLGGIGAFHNGEGNIMMDLSSRVEGSRTGITAKHDGEGDLSIIVGSAIPAAANGTIKATGNRPTDHAIDVTHSGAGRITITLDGDVTSAGGNGVNATTGANGTGITVNLGDGNVAGGRGGLNVQNGGLGDVSITTADAAVIGTTHYGIQVRDQNRGGVFVTTGTGNADGLAVKGGLGGVHVSNQGQGSIAITVGNGDIEGTRLQGIYARNMSDAGAISITLNGTAAVTGGYNGMYVYNSGLDATTIDLSGATGIVAGRNEDGLSARAGYANAGDLTITTGAGAGGVAVIGYGNGIDADHVGSGSINITTGSGFITGNGINGIEARLSDSGRDITIMTGVGTVAGGTDGIFTDNAGVGSLSITTRGEVRGREGSGIRAYNGGTAYSGVYPDASLTTLGTNLTITTNADVLGGGGHGIDASNAGSGELRITTNAIVQGNAGNGINAGHGTIAGGTIYGTNLVITTEGLVSGSDMGILARNIGLGDTRITTNADVSGNTGNGISAYHGILYDGSAHGGKLAITTNAKVLGRGGSGIYSRNVGTGDLSINISGPQSLGYGGFGLRTASNGVTAIGIGSLTTVEGSLGGIEAVTTGAGIFIDNAGVIRSLNGHAASLAVDASGGDVSHNNKGVMTGRIRFGAGGDSLRNSGRWTVVGTNDFGPGEDLLTNTNIIVAASRARLPETTVFSGLETFRNEGTINLSDDVSGGGSVFFDTLQIAGDFTGFGGVLQLDVSLGGIGSLADTLVINGTATGVTGIVLNNTRPGTGGLNADILLVDTTGATGNEFVLAGRPILVGAYSYDLFFEDNDFFLRSTLEIPRLDAASLSSVMGDVWDISAAGWHHNGAGPQRVATGGDTTLSSRGTGPGGMGTARGWGTLIIDERDGEGTVNADVDGARTSTDITFDQSTRAAFGGFDLIFTPDTIDGTLTFGTLLGVIDSRVDFDLTTNRADFNGPTYGLRLSYASDSVRADLIVKRDDLDLEYTVAGLSDEPGRAKAVSTGASLEFGVKVHETPAMTVEAVGNLSHVSTRIGSFSVGPTAFDFGSGDTSRGAVGLNLRGTSMLAGTGFFPSATLKYWNVFNGGYTSAINTVAFSYDGTGSYVEASAMLEYHAPDTGWGGFVAGSGFFGGASSGVRAQVGLNLEW